MNITEGWAIFWASVLVGGVISIFQALVIKRLDKMEKIFETKFDENIEAHDKICSENLQAHERLWIEHNKAKLDTIERLSGLEKQLEIENRIKNLLTTT